MTVKEPQDDSGNALRSEMAIVLFFLPTPAQLQRAAVDLPARQVERLGYQIRRIAHAQAVGQRIGEHGAVGRRMQDIGAAFFLAQADLGRPHIEEKHVLILHRVRQLQQGLGGCVHQYKSMAAVRQLLQRPDGITAVFLLTIHPGSRR